MATKREIYRPKWTPFTRLPPVPLAGWNFSMLLFPLMVSKTKVEETGLQTLVVGLALLLTAQLAQRKEYVNTSHPSKPKLRFPLLWLLTVLHENLRSTFRSNRLPRWQRWQCFPSSQTNHQERVLLGGSIISVQAELSWGTACRTKKPWCNPSGPFLCSLAVPSWRPCCALKSTFRGPLPLINMEAVNPVRCVNLDWVQALRHWFSVALGSLCPTISHRPTDSPWKVHCKRERRPVAADWQFSQWQLIHHFDFVPFTISTFNLYFN